MENSIESFRGYLLILAETSLPRKLYPKIDPSDLVQITIMKAIACKEELRDFEPRVVKAWLRTILTHNIVDTIKHYDRAKRDVAREKDVQANLDQSHAGLEGWLAAEQTSPSMAAARNEDLARVFDAVAKLPDSMRQVVLMKHVQQMSLNDIAEETERTIPAVAGLLRRGLAQLRENL